MCACDNMYKYTYVIKKWPGGGACVSETCHAFFISLACVCVCVSTHEMSASVFTLRGIY